MGRNGSSVAFIVLRQLRVPNKHPMLVRGTDRQKHRWSMGGNLAHRYIRPRVRIEPELLSEYLSRFGAAAAHHELGARHHWA